MSFKAMAWAASVKTNTPTQKLILLMLADKANDEGFCWPKMKTIALDCCMSRKCVLENVKKLASHGFVLVEKRTVKAEEGRSHNCSHLYQVMIGTAPLGYTRVTESDSGRVTEGDKQGNPELQTRVTEGYNKNLSVEPVKETIIECDAKFQEFWEAYPKRSNGNPKKPAMQKFLSAVKRGADPEKIIFGAKNYAKQEQKSGNIGTNYVAMAQTWLNQERWEDFQTDTCNVKLSNGKIIDKKYVTTLHCGDVVDRREIRL